MEREREKEKDTRGGSGKQANERVRGFFCRGVTRVASNSHGIEGRGNQFVGFYSFTYKMLSLFALLLPVNVSVCVCACAQTRGLTINCPRGKSECRQWQCGCGGWVRVCVCVGGGLCSATLSVLRALRRRRSEWEETNDKGNRNRTNTKQTR